MRRERGFTLLELIVSMTVFGMFLTIVVILTAEMRGQENRTPIDFQQHPQIIAVLSRLRKDVLDAFGSQPYPPTYPQTNPVYKQSAQVLIVYSVQSSGFTETVVWDFSTPGVARRKAYSVGGVVSDWAAAGVPQFTVEAFDITDFAAAGATTTEGPIRPWGVRIRALNKKGQLVIDEILQPRTHE